MTLLLTGTEDHAVLAMVIKEAQAAAGSRGGFVGRTAVQKIMYFLNAVGVPMNYRFDIYHYGPFCETILRDVEWLIADGVVVDRSNQADKYSNYAPGPAINELLNVHEGALRVVEGKIKSIAGALAKMRPEKLELFATLDYVYRQETASGGSHGRKSAVISRFIEIKKDKFSRVQVEKAYDVMVQAGILTE
jgi:uncharacterized protein